MADKTEFEYLSVTGQTQRLELPEKALAFTLCQVPVVMQLMDKSTTSSLTLNYQEGESQSSEVLEIDREMSEKIFCRSAKISQITIMVSESALL